MASAYVDQEINAHEARETRAHLAICPLCRRYLQELEETSLLFKGIPRPEVPRELRGYVMTAIEGRAAGELSLRQRLMEWMLKINPRPFSWATGVVTSILLFAATLSGFRPIPVDTSKLTALPPPPPIIERIIGTDDEFKALNGGAITVSIADNQQYELPQMDNPEEWGSFSRIAYQKPGNESMAALLQIEKDGRARLVKVLDDSKDPMVVEQLWWILANPLPTFKPAMINGEPVTTQVVAFFEKVDIGG